MRRVVVRSVVARRVVERCGVVERSRRVVSVQVVPIRSCQLGMTPHDTLSGRKTPLALSLVGVLRFTMSQSLTIYGNFRTISLASGRLPGATDSQSSYMSSIFILPHGDDTRSTRLQ